MAILAIDQGTSGTKALVISAAGKILARGFCALDVKHLPDGGAESDPVKMWQSLLVASTAAITAVPGSSEEITAVGLANQGESILEWDKTSGEALSPVIGWQDSRSASLCQERSGESEKVLARTGLAITPYFVAPKIAWLRSRSRNNSQSVITTTDTWLLFKLTGKFITDPATASRTLLFDLEQKKWDQELADIWQLDIAQCPTLIENDAIVGEINHPDLPKLRGTPLAGIIVDQPAALLAERSLKSGEGKCTYGTGAFVLTNIGHSPKISQHGLATSLAWTIRSKSAYYFDGQVFTAASALQWLIDNTFITSAEEIDYLPEARGVQVAPGFAGYGAPIWRPKATASFGGITLSTTKQEIARGVIDGIAAQIADLILAMNLDGVSISKLRVDGGLTQSRTLMQMQADLAQVEIEVFPHPDATAVGVGALTMMAMDAQVTVDKSIPEWAPLHTYSPIWSAARAEEYLDRWRLLQQNSLERSSE